MEPLPYRIERLSDDRLQDVQQLLGEVLHQRVTLEWVRKKYDTRHTGVQYMSAIAYDGLRPIAFYGAIPQYFTSPDGERWLGCHACDSMTLEAYQRRGLHQRLALTTYDWMRAAGVKVVYAFHSENTFHSCKKLDWAEWGRLRGYSIPVSRLPIAKVLRRLPFIQNWHLKRIAKSFVQYQIAEFRNSNAQTGIAVEYSPAYKESKQFHTQLWVECASVQFWLSIDAIVRVGDAHFADAGHFAKGLSELKRICARLGFDQILFQTYEGSPLDLALATANYPSFESWRAGYLALSPDLDFQQYLPNYADQDSF